MRDSIKGAIIGAAGTIVAAIIAGLIAWKQFELQAAELSLAKQQAEEAKLERDKASKEAEALKQQILNGPREFVRRFGGLIDQAVSETDKKNASSQLIPFARAIVSQRDSLRAELGGLDKLLDSNIDLLGMELSKPSPDQTKIRSLVVTLKATWPLKEQEILLRIARLQAVLSFLQNVDAQKPEE